MAGGALKYPKHNWLEKPDGTHRCLRCGVWKRGRGIRLQFSRLPYMKGKGWVSGALLAPPCVVVNPPTLEKEA